MTIVKNSRQLIGCLLLVSLLFNGFACSLQHASHVGFELAMGQGMFCLSDDGDFVPGDLAGDPVAALALPFDCPLCSSLFVALVALFGLIWPGRRTPRSIPLRRAERLGPRHHWPTLNPRAP
ncbi:hypothetical protein DP64_04970 [Stutzerimonas degradans]|nr:hypothetical protein DP64_04970 [Stutzerimonas degradans]QCT95838.1 DUF2946 domain-containing protein [Stutzerimonas degradans]